MANPKHTLAPCSQDSSFDAGGPIAAIHYSIEDRISATGPVPSEIDDYCDPLSPTQSAIRKLSRVIGILGLGLSVIAVGALIIKIF